MGWQEMKNFYGSDVKQVSNCNAGADRKEWINYCEERSIPSMAIMAK
jgi:hypothetical protein